MRVATYCNNNAAISFTKLVIGQTLEHCKGIKGLLRYIVQRAKSIKCKQKILKTCLLLNHKYVVSNTNNICKRKRKNKTTSAHCNAIQGIKVGNQSLHNMKGSLCIFTGSTKETQGHTYSRPNMI